MKPIIFFVSHPYLGGSQEYIYDLARKLKQNKKYCPIVISLFKGPLINKLKKNNIETSIFNIGNIFENIIEKQNFLIKGVKIFLFLFASIFFILKLICFIKRRKIVILYNNTLRAQILGGITAKLTKISNIWHIHSQFKVNIFHYIAAKLADKIMVASKKVKQDIIFLTRREKFEVIYNGVDLEKFSYKISGKKIRKQYNIGLEENIIGMIGTFISLKGHKYFLEAASEIIKCCENIKFLVVGEEPYKKKEYTKKLHYLSYKLGLEKFLIFTGYKDNLPEILASFTILVVPSLEESFGRIIIEAMAMKKPVIATSVGGIPEIITDGITGILIPPKDSNQIKKAIFFLLANKEKQEEIVSNAYKLLKEKFLLEIIVRKIERILDSLK